MLPAHENGVLPKRLTPKDAASLVLVDRTDGAPRILMGRRRADLVFLANKYVFPGGRVDPRDKTRPAASELSAATVASLLKGMRGRPSIPRARALAIAAVRELHEETGVALGVEGPPMLAGLTYFARAITPPGRPRRYDTRFFLAEAGAASLARLGGDGELVDLAWLTLEQARLLDLPSITRLIIEDVAGVLAGHGAGGIAFYYHRSGSLRRELL